MQPFDFDAYIANRAAADNKLQGVLDASKQKQAQLQIAGEEKKAELDKSWVTQLGMDPGGFLANRVNDIASLVSGASRLAGQTASLPVSLGGTYMAHDATPEDYDAYNRVRTGKATAEDWARLNQRTTTSNSTILEGLQAQDKARGIARDINDTADLTGIVNQHNREGLNQDLAQGFDANWGKVTSGNTLEVVQGLGGLIANAGSALLHNPSAVREYVLENAPQLFVGAFGKAGQAAMLASNVGYAVDEYQKGIENWQKANGGALPPEEVRNHMALQAASLAIAEEGGDLIGLNAAKLLGKAAEGTTRQGFKQSLKSVGRAAFEGAAGETPTEGYQTYMEGQIEGKPATPLEIYQAGVIGGASGGVLSGGGRTLHEAVLPAGQKKPEPVVSPKVDELRTQAIQTGDVSALTDAQNQQAYAPDHAIAALYGHSKKDGTSDEARAQNLRKSEQILSDLEDRHFGIQQQLATPEERQGRIDSLTRQLEKTPTTDTAMREALQAVIDMERGNLAKGPLDAATSKGLQAELARLDQQLGRSRRAHENLKALVSKPAEEQAGKLLDAAEANDTQATERVLNLAMASPQALDPVRLKKLADNQANGLSDEQRGLLRQFAEARIAQNSLRDFNDVGREIVEGSKANLGLQQYQGIVGAAIARGDQKTAQKYIALLHNFAASHTDKARKAKAAEKQGGAKHVARLADGSWEIRDGHLSEAERKKNGAWNVFPNGKGEDIRNEAKAIAATSLALKAAYASRFTPNTQTVTTTTEGASNVQDVPPQGANPQSERQAAPVQGQGTVGETGQPGQPAAGATAASTGVEGAGIAKTNFRQRVLGLIRGHAELSDEDRGLLAHIPKDLQIALTDREGLILGLREGEDLLDDETLAEQRQSVQPQLDELGAKVRQLYAAIDTLYDEQTVSPAPDSTGSTGTEKSVDRVSDAPVAPTPVEGKTQSTGEGTVASQEAAPADQIKENPDPVESTAEVSQESDTGSASSIAESPEATTESSSDIEGLQALADGRKANAQLKDQKLGEVFRKINRAAAWLKQKSTPLEKAKDISQIRPLVGMRNFLERWTKDKDLIKELFAGQLKDDGPEATALLQFRVTANAWRDTIRANFIKGSLPNSKGNQVQEDFLYKDPLQDFFAADGTLDENVVTAVAYGAYSWLMDSTMGAAKKTDDAILAMHGMRPGDAEVTRPGRKALNLLAANRDTALASMGRYVVDALGLSAGPDASLDYLPNLTTAFGAQVLRILEQQGHVETQTYYGDELNGFIDGLNLQPTGERVLKQRNGQPVLDENGQPKKVPVYEERHYVKVTRNEKTLVLSDAVRAMRDATVGSAGVLQRLFSTEYARSEASTRPIPYTQEDVRRTGQNVPEELRQVVEEQQKIPHRIIPAMHRAIQVLGRQAVLTAAGWRQLGDDRIQFENRDAVETQNLNLESQFDDGMGLVKAHPEGTAFYIAYDVWTNFRVGIATRNLNPQSSKIHRFVFARPEWEATIDLDNAEQMTHYMTAVAQALGIKVDQQSNAKSANWVIDWLNSEDNQMVPLIEKLHRGEAFTPAEQQRFGEFAAGKEGMQTLQALVSLGEYLAAFNAEGVTSFKTTMLVGVDGKANGPMLTIQSLGAAKDAEGLAAFLRRGGFYRESDGVTNYSQWYGPQADGTVNQDLYQDMGGRILGALDLQNPENERARQDLTQLSVITRNLLNGKNGLVGAITSAGRSLAKLPQTSFNFGSAIQRSIESMAGELVQGVFDRIEALATDPGVVREGLTREKLIAAINHFMADRRLHIPADTSIEQLMGMKFEKNQKEALQAGFSAFLGETVKEVMEGVYGKLIERRNALNSQVRTAFDIYNQVFQDLREREMERLMDEGLIAFDLEMKKNPDGSKSPTGKRKPLHDMSRAQEDALIERVKDILPIAHSAYSDKANDLDSGIYMGKTARTTGREAFNQIEVQFGTRFRDTIHQIARSMKIVESSPGVAALAYLMHSFDSAVMHRSIKGTQTLNVHDEAANAADKVTDTARRINFQLWKSMVQFSPNTSAFEMLERSVTNLVQLAKDGTIAPETLKAIQEQLRDQATQMVKAQVKAANPKWNGKQVKARVDHLMSRVGPESLAEFVLEQAKAAQYTADRVRLEGLSQMAIVDQYTWEGGEYRVTDKERAEVKEMLRLHVEQGAKLSPETLAAAKELGQLMAAKKTAEAQAAPQQTPASEPAADAGAQRQASSPFGELVTPGKQPTVSSHPDLVTFFAQNPKTTVGAVLAQLYSLLHDQKTGSTKHRDFYLELIRVLDRTTDKGLSVTLVTKDSPADLMKSAEKAPFNSTGWYNTQGEGIFVLSTDFQNSALKPELLLHEMTHNALVDIVEQAQKGNAPQSVIARVASLTNLWQLAQKFVKDTPALAGKYGTELANLHEFIAYGMTRESFQREVLAQMTVPAEDRSKQPVSGWKKFVQTVTEILFRGSNKDRQAQMESGLANFLSDTSALFAQVEKAREQSRETTGKANHPVSGLGNLSMASPGARTYSTLDIFEALDNGQGDISPTFADSLRGLLGGIVDALHGPFGSFKADLMQNTTDGELGVWFKAMMTGKLPFASQAVAAGFRVSDQELFAIEQVEATVRAAMDGNEAQTKVAARELAELYQQVYKRLKVSDFERVTSSPAEARALYDFVFKMEKSSGDRSDYLARFASLALGHQGFNSLLKVATTRDGRSVKDGKSIAEKVQIVFEHLLAWFRDKVTDTFTGQHEDAKVRALVEQLVDIEAKQREKLANPDLSSKVLTSLEEGAKSFAGSVRDTALKILESSAVAKSRSGIVRGVGAMAHSVVGGYVDAFGRELNDFRDRLFEGQQGTVAGLLNEVRGPSAIMNNLLNLRKNQERERQRIVEGTAETTKSLFVHGGKNISKKANAAVTQVLLRTGAHTLLEGDNATSMARLEVLLADQAELDAEIAALEAQLPADSFGTLMIFQAKTLAYDKVTGINRSPELMFNAHNIARLLGTAMAEEITPSQAQQAERVLEKLISLYGLAYSRTDHKTLVREVLQAENARSDGGNGVEFLLKAAAMLRQDALQRTFGGKKTLMIHGYTPEIYNPHVDVKTATAQAGAALEAQGYVRGEEVRIDPHDPDQERKYLYVMRDGPQQPWLSGITALTGMRAKGSKMHSGYLNIRTQEGLENAQMNAALINARQPALQRAAQIGRSYDPRKDDSRYMAPVFNDQGDIVNWRDMMLEETKDTLLERDNRFEVVLGKLAGQVFDKATAKEVNRQVIEAVKRRFDEEYEHAPDSYMEVGPKSDDPELREIWHLLPDETQAIVREVWGRNAMMIRKDEKDIVFGYRKYSLADMWDKDPDARNLLEKIIVNLMTEIFGDKAALRMRQGERGWQELVKEAKDNIVVKTGSVLLGNILSNFTFLWLRGVPIKSMGHDTLVALKGATSYMDDSRELRRLKLLRDAGHTQGKDVQIARDIVRLEDAIARNPVTKLVEAGLMPSIVEDLDASDDIYSYKSLFTRTTEKYTDKLHPTVKTIGKSLYLAHDTSAYQILSRATQLSDFVARYTLYQHLTTKKDAVSHAEAIHDASESFINYDVPSHQMVQYANDVGLVMFTKYFLRIQRILGKASKENPLRYYAMLMASHFLTLGPNVLDSLWIRKVGHNPLRMGALDWFSSLKNIGLVNLEKAVI